MDIDAGVDIDIPVEAWKSAGIEETASRQLVLNPLSKQSNPPPS